MDEYYLKIKYLYKKGILFLEASFTVSVNCAALCLSHLFNVFECFACTWMCTKCVHGGLGGQKKALDPLETELGMVVSRCVGAWDSAWVLWESCQCSSIC